METTEKIEGYFAREHPFKAGLSLLRNLVQSTELEEKYKWGAPIYTLANKNLLGLLVFKSYFGIWFFNGSLLKDPLRVLENAQEGKTKALRHWKFTSVDTIDPHRVLDYIHEAIENQKNGLTVRPKIKKAMEIPPLLMAVLQEYPKLKSNFESLTPYKQREYCDYIAEAKLEKTKTNRLEKVLPLLQEGCGLHDRYRR